MKIEKMFNKDKYNVMYQSIINLGAYDWLENTPKTTLTCELVDEIERLGYKIVEKGYHGNEDSNNN